MLFFFPRMRLIFTFRLASRPFLTVICLRLDLTELVPPGAVRWQVPSETLLGNYRNVLFRVRQTFLILPAHFPSFNSKLSCNAHHYLEKHLLFARSQFVLPGFLLSLCVNTACDKRGAIAFLLTASEPDSKSNPTRKFQFM